MLLSFRNLRYKQQHNMEQQIQNNSYPVSNKLTKGTLKVSLNHGILIELADAKLEPTMNEVQALLREILQIPPDYSVLILNNNRNLERSGIFSMLNFSKGIRGGFLDTGSCSSTAIIDARKYFDVEIISSSRESCYSYIPQCNWIPYNISFLHLTSTNGLQGNRVSKFPKVSVPVLCDRSADLFNAQISFNFFDMVYAHGCAGKIIPEHLSIICIRDSLLEKSTFTLFNEPLTENGINQAIESNFDDMFLFYHRLMGFKANGGLQNNVSRLCRCSLSLYREIERNTKFRAIVNPKDRSVHAVRFCVANPEDEFRLIVQLDKENINIVDRLPQGDLLVNLEKYKEDEILELINSMQCFELNYNNENN
jgi:phosphoserine aminotransferase